ncbi:DUF3168 domain-containing protein [Methylobacterium sp. JK268]
MTPEIALLDALTAILVADPTLAGIISGRVYDEVPAEGAPQDLPPYVYMGPMNRRRVILDCCPVWTVRARIYAISIDFGRRQAWEIIEAVAQALDLKDAPAITLASPYVIQQPLQVEQGGDVFDPTLPRSVFLDVSTTIARAA